MRQTVVTVHQRHAWTGVDRRSFFLVARRRRAGGFDDFQQYENCREDTDVGDFAKTQTLGRECGWFRNELPRRTTAKNYREDTDVGGGVWVVWEGTVAETRSSGGLA